MLTTVEVDVSGGLQPLMGAAYRYRMLGRVRENAHALGIRVYAFGFGHRHLRLLVSGGSMAVGQLTRSLKVSASNTARHLGLRWDAESTWVQVWGGRLVEGAAWVQRGGRPQGQRDALGTPWSSHRDVLGLRRAPFFDPTPLRVAVDVKALHQACSKGPVPAPPERIPRGLQLDLHGLHRVAAAVHGVMPEQRRCYATFVQLADRCGASREAIGATLAVGERRVRHYLSQPSDAVPAALTCLTDPRLLRVP